MIRRIFCVLLISIGAALDVYFFIFRFRADGTILPIAIAAACGLEIFLAFCVLNARGSRIFTALSAAVVAFVVIQTSAGQTFSLLSRDAAAGDVSQTVKALMQEEEKNLSRLDSEYSTITRQLSSIRTVEDRAAYGETIRRMTARLADLSKERGAASSRLSKLAEKNGNAEIEKIRVMSVYDFYASMPGWNGKEWLTFAFHTFLSILIALMTPIGLLTWEPKSAGRILRKTTLTEKEVSTWVEYCWYKVRLGTQKKIIDEEVFFQNAVERDGRILSPNVYKDCHRRALALGIITRDLTAIITDEALIKDKILKGR